MMSTLAMAVVCSAGICIMHKNLIDNHILLQGLMLCF